MKQINIAKKLKWLACAVVVAAAISFAFAPQLGVSARQNQQDKKQPPQKQDPQKPPKKTDEMETVKIGTQLVNLLFSVQDKQNRFINDLKQEEIQILENGQPQESSRLKKKWICH
jgi:flagellar biosynthesis/type III secretory pathway M-ring protein FliF/YscJ